MAAVRELLRESTMGCSIYPFTGERTAYGGFLEIYNANDRPGLLLLKRDEGRVVSIMSAGNAADYTITSFYSDGRTSQEQVQLTSQELKVWRESGEIPTTQSGKDTAAPLGQVSSLLDLFYQATTTSLSNNNSPISDEVRRELLPILPDMVTILRKNAENPFGQIHDSSVAGFTQKGTLTTYVIDLYTDNGPVKAIAAIDTGKKSIAAIVLHGQQDVRLIYKPGDVVFEKNERTPIPKENIALSSVASIIRDEIMSAYESAFTEKDITIRLPQRERRLLGIPLPRVDRNATSLLYNGAPHLQLVAIDAMGTQHFKSPEGKVTFVSRGDEHIIIVSKGLRRNGIVSFVEEKYFIKKSLLREWVQGTWVYGKWKNGKWVNVGSSNTYARINELCEQAQKARIVQSMAVEEVFTAVRHGSFDDWLVSPASIAPLTTSNTKMYAFAQDVEPSDVPLSVVMDVRNHWLL